MFLVSCHRCFCCLASPLPCSSPTSTSLPPHISTSLHSLLRASHSCPRFPEQTHHNHFQARTGLTFTFPRFRYTLFHEHPERREYYKWVLFSYFYWYWC
ncbi:hypothetical protein BDQ17DRAFT_452759 [Cyathus striatus]|nr:hypothetical protein BDQ17DRAFT_452759 [Cyathus striatus]